MAEEVLLRSRLNKHTMMLSAGDDVMLMVYRHGLLMKFKWGEVAAVGNDGTCLVDFGSGGRFLAKRETGLCGKVYIFNEGMGRISHRLERRLITRSKPIVL